MARIKDQCTTRPGLAVGLTLTLAALIVASIIPFSYSQTTGWTVSLTGGNTALAASPQVVTAALATAGLEDISVSASSVKLKDAYVIANIPTEKAARALAEVFAVAGDPSVAVNVEPVVAVQAKPLLAQIYSRVKPEESERLRLRFKDGQLLINGEGISDAIRSADLSDDEVLAEIRRILKDRGIDEDDIAVSVTSSDDGKVRMVEIQTSDAVVTGIDKPEVLLNAGKGALGLKYRGDIPHVDSGMVVELAVPEKDSTVVSTGIILRIAVDKKRSE